MARAPAVALIAGLVGLLCHSHLALALIDHNPEERPLFLTDLLNEGRIHEARERSKVTINGTFMGHSGYFSTPSASGDEVNHLFTWFQPCTQCDPETAPLIQWFNGGPGSPDTTGALNQIGKFYIGPNQDIRKRCFTWCLKYNCLFVDSPTMTGFSYQTDKKGGYNPANIEYTATSGQAATQVLDVLVQFLKVWPQYQNAPYYVQGLSYGGHYVPKMAEAVLHHNKNTLGQHIYLKGIAVGNPEMDNEYQFPTYARTLETFGLLMDDEVDQVNEIMRKASYLNSRDCERSFMEWNRVFNDDGGSSCAPHCEFLFQKFSGSDNTENVLLGNQPKIFDYFRTFLRNHQKEFHVAGNPVSGQSMSEGGEVYATMVRSGDLCEPSSPLYTKLFLEEGLDVIIYSGNMDPLLGPPTTAAGIRSAWDYAEEFISGGQDARRAYYRQKKTIWRVNASDPEPAGYAKCLSLSQALGSNNRFCYVVVRGAGHEAASYTPRSMYDLNERFLQGRSFDGSSEGTPQCAACGGAPPLAGPALPECNQ